MVIEGTSWEYCSVLFLDHRCDLFVKFLWALDLYVQFYSCKLYFKTKFKRITQVSEVFFILPEREKNLWMFEKLWEETVVETEGVRR